MRVLAPVRFVNRYIEKQINLKVDLKELRKPFRFSIDRSLIEDDQTQVIAHKASELGMRKALEADRELLANDGALLKQILGYRRYAKTMESFLKGPNLEATSNVRPSTVRVNNYLRREIRALEELLISKNSQYDNAALEPIHVFSNLDALQTIKVRIDDKLKRLSGWFQNPENAVTVETIYANEDTISDLIGYLFLLRAGARFSHGALGDDAESAQGETAVMSEAHALEIEKERLTHLALQVNKNTTYNIERDKQIANDRAQLDADIAAFEAVKVRTKRRKTAARKKKTQPRVKRSYTRKKTARKKTTRKKAR